MCDEYNGYTNYQTWVTSLWLSNDEGSYLFWQETALEYGNTYDFTQYLKESHSEHSPTIERADVYSDLLGHALQMVNWDEIGENIWHESREGIEV